MSQHNFPLHDIRMSRLEKGLCIKCGKNNIMNDRRLGVIDSLCPKCRAKCNKQINTRFIFSQDKINAL